MTPKKAFKRLCDLSIVDDEEDYKMWLVLKGNVEQVLNDYEDLKINNERQFKALERAKKVEELLKLYRQYYNRIPIGTSMYKVELEIARLEKELESKLNEIIT